MLPLDLTPPASTARLTFAAVLESIYGQRYCGPITVHFMHGAPTVVEVPTRDVLRVELQAPPKPPAPTRRT